MTSSSTVGFSPWLSRETDKTLIIAEAGVNHNGSMKLAHELIDVAKAAGADVVKFQLFDPKTLTVQSAPLANYQAKQAEPDVESQQELLNSLVLKPEQFKTLSAYCKQVGLSFACTPFDWASARFLIDECGVPFLKLSSGDLTAIPLLKAYGAFNVPLIISTGMATLAEVDEAVRVIRSTQTQLSEREGLAILHCVSAYPTPLEAVNLRTISTLQQAFPNHWIGFSDHTAGLDCAPVAAGLGARIVEKHFTLDNTLPGPDHAASLEPGALTEWVKRLRTVEQAMGTWVKVPQPCEQDCKTVARRSVVTTRALNQGHLLCEADLTLKRPATGLHPRELHKLVGRKLNTAVTEDTLLSEAHLLAR